jgi:hypothetical protein
MVEGAVYSPVVLIEPTAGLIDHVTAVFVVPETAAVNCCVCDGPRAAVVGETDTVTTVGGTSVTVADALFAGSAWLVAVTVTVCCVVMLEGAVYSPVVLMEPTSGLIDQVTAVFVVPVTAAVNCCVCDGPRLTVVGETDTVTTCGGSSVTVAEALFAGSA